MRQNKLFSIDEFKVRLNEAKEFKESFRKKEPSKQNEMKVHLRTYTINDNRRIMYDFLKKRNLFDKVYDEISYLCEKAISKDYEPTNHERFIFNEIKNIIDNMSKWF